MKDTRNQLGKRLNSPTSNPMTAVAAVKATSIQTSEKLDDTLTDQERELLVECESDIEQNLQGAFVFGYRLNQISEQKLHRATYKTFEAYCRKRWDFSKSHANRLIQAYLCQKHLNGIKDVEVYVPTKESQVRYIADLKPEQQVEVAKAVYEEVGDKKASAGDFGEAREKLYPKPKPVPKAPKAAQEDTNNDEVKVAPVKFDPNLVSLLDLTNLAKLAYNTYSNPEKSKELEKTLWKIKEGLKEWADWEAKQLNEQEVA